MSVFRDTPVVSRFVDIREREKRYQQHIKALRSTKALINTNQPDTPGRFKVHHRNTKIYRKNVKKNIDIHDKLIEDTRRQRMAESVLANDLSPRRRPKTSLSKIFINENDVYRKEYDRIKFNTSGVRLSASTDYESHNWFFNDKYAHRRSGGKEKIFIGPSAKKANKVVISKEDSINKSINILESSDPSMVNNENSGFAGDVNSGLIVDEDRNDSKINAATSTRNDGTNETSLGLSTDTSKLSHTYKGTRNSAKLSSFIRDSINNAMKSYGSSNNTSNI